MRRVIAVSLSAWLVGQTLPQGAAAEPARVADPISVVAFVEPSEDPERPLLHVERFTIREGG
jgi:hypothetical protein